MVQRYNGATVQWCNGATVQCATVQRYNGATAQRCKGTTVQRHYGILVGEGRRFNGFQDCRIACSSAFQVSYFLNPDIQ
jgi:hypothetical protein